MRTWLPVLCGGVLTSVALCGCMPDAEYRQQLTQAGGTAPGYGVPAPTAATVGGSTAAVDGFDQPRASAAQPAFQQESEGDLEQQRTAELLAQQQINQGPVAQPDDTVQSYQAAAASAGQQNGQSSRAASYRTGCQVYTRAGRSRPILCRHQMTRTLVRRLQRALRDAGYDPGPIDGVYGRRTRAALNAYERAEGLPVDREVNLSAARSLGLIS